MKNLFATIVVLMLLSSAAHAQFGDFEINIDRGNTYATKRGVVLELRSKYQYQMMLSNRPDFPGGEWIAYQTTFPEWRLTGSEGKAYVYVKYKDKEGNVSKAVSDDIILDLTPPQNASVEILLPGKVTNDPKLEVKIQLKADDAKFVMVSNNSSFFNSSWQKYEAEYAKEGMEWQLEVGDDGWKSVFVKYKDIAQNETLIFKDKIFLDTEIPFNCTIMLDEGKNYSINQDQIVELRLTANGADSMMISEDATMTGAEWQPFEELPTFKLSDGDGKKTVFVKFKDRSGNTSEPIQDDIYLDITPPIDCAITINGGAEETEDINKKVNLSFSAEEDVVQMMVSNTPSFSTTQWRGFVSEIRDWKLEGEPDGKRTVYVKFKDKAGNISSVFRDEIELKRGM